jgi:hypothetical protein
MPDHEQQQQQQQQQHVYSRDSTELRLLKLRVEQIERFLHGNGQPGLVDRQEARFKEIGDMIKTFDRRFAWMFGAFIVLQFLTNSGLISLKSLIGPH